MKKDTFLISEKRPFVEDYYNALLNKTPVCFCSVYQRKLFKVKLFMYKTYIGKAVHFIWSGGHDSLFWLSQQTLFRLVPWLIVMPAEAPNQVTKCLYFLLERVEYLYGNNFKMPLILNKALHYIEDRY
jgi:hypothetical protein